MAGIKPIVTRQVRQHQPQPHHFSQTPSTTLGWCIPCSLQEFCSRTIPSDRKGVSCGILGLSHPTLFTVSVKSTAQPSDSLLGNLLSTLQKETPHSLPAFLALTRLSPFAVTATPLPCTLIEYSQTISAGIYYPKEII